MRILFLSQYFPPEMEVGGTRIHETALYFIKMGHDVTVLTGFPNYPSGKIFEGYKRRFILREEKDGIKIIRTWIYPYHKGSLVKRIFNQVSFLLCSTLALPFIPRVDLVVVATPPVFSGISGWVISRVKKIPFIMEVRDIWPETAVILGLLRNKYLILAGKKLNSFLFKKTDLLITVSHDMKKAIQGYSVRSEKIKIIPNGVDTEQFKPENKMNRIRKEYNPENSFLIIYIGTFGVIHALDQVIQAAGLLKDEKDIKFLLVGDGREKQHLMEIKRKAKISNLVFLNAVEKSKVKDFIIASDICLSPRKYLKDPRLNFPAKIFEYMACEKPVILSENRHSEAKKVLEEAGAGLWTDPENSREIADAIMKLENNPELCLQMGRKGREYALKHYSRELLSARYEKELKNL